MLNINFASSLPIDCNIKKSIITNESTIVEKENIKLNKGPKKYTTINGKLAEVIKCPGTIKTTITTKKLENGNYIRLEVYTAGPRFVRCKVEGKDKIAKEY